MYPRRFCVIVAAALFGMGLASAQDAQTTKTVWSGIYSSAQAARGKDQYFANCVSCHGDQLQGGDDAPPISGSTFLDSWGNKPLAALYDFVSTKMPASQPGFLRSDAYADIIAFILSSNGFPAGSSDLPPDDQVLSHINVQAKP